jgi:hypothetical protein
MVNARMQMAVIAITIFVTQNHVILAVIMQEIVVLDVVV